MKKTEQSYFFIKIQTRLNSAYSSQTQWLEMSVRDILTVITITETQKKNFRYFTINKSKILL